MLETAGVLAQVKGVRWLVAFAMLPMLWSIACIVQYVWRASLGLPRRSSPVVTVALGGSLLSLAGAFAFALALARMPQGSVLEQQAAQLVRIGLLDLDVTFALGPKNIAFVVTVALVGCASIIDAASVRRSRSPLDLAWNGLMLGGALVMCSGDGLVPIMAGLGALSLGSWAADRGKDSAHAAATVFGNAAILLGFLGLFWSMGGSMSADGYDPDTAPRMLVVATSEPGADAAKATLSMTTLRGALVSSDDADLPNEPVASPFSMTVDPMVTTLRVVPGGASRPIVLPKVALLPGKTHVLTPYGPTVSLRSLDDQSSAPRTAGADVATRFGLSAKESLFVVLCMFGGAMAYLFALARVEGRSTLSSLLLGLPAAYVATRFAHVIDPSGLDGTAVLTMGAFAAAVFASSALAADDPYVRVRRVQACFGALAVASVGLGCAPAPLLYGTVGTVAAMAALVGIDNHADERWSRVALAGAAGVLPAAGTNVAHAETFSTVATRWSTSHEALGFALTTLVAAVLIAAVFIASVACFQVQSASFVGHRFSGRGDHRVSRDATLPMVLTTIGLVGAVVLGVGTASWGGSIRSPAWLMVGPPAGGATVGRAAFGLAASLLPAVAGAYVAGRPGAFEGLRALARALMGALDSARRGIREGALFLADGAESTERRVVGAVHAAVAEATHRVWHRISWSAERIAPVVVVFFAVSFVAMLVSGWVTR